eukprot:TRINITY_DN8798_c0_g1_i3.p1 TRINITY_DN8798_c0_g1~~TRINITY_DN8798_c0_g1_i3.p1  ORF type:complete len:376 (+),score=102.53 TRINITY_DN8798_c0_g1_i3:73-1200(+)
MSIAGQAMFNVEVPAGVGPGQLIQTQSPDGQILQVAVPDGYSAGMQFPVTYTPMAVAMAQPVMAQPVMAQPMMQQPMMQQPMMQPMAQPLMAPGGMAPGIMYPTLADPWAMLSQMDQVMIKEKVQLAEVLIGFEMPNKYMLKDPKTGQDVFIAAEKSDGVLGVLGRQVFEGGDRPFNMDIAMMTGPGQPPLPFVHLERPFKCTCCCYQRPEVFISDANSGAVIGSVIDPFACCMMTFDIKDRNQEPVLEISHSPFSCALCCWGCPCGCQEVDFEVKDKGSGETVGHIRKQFRGAEAVAMVTGLGIDADQYTVEFSGIHNTEWKAILLGTALFLDFRFFTNGGQTQREESALGRIAQNNDGVAGALGPVAGLFGAN